VDIAEHKPAYVKYGHLIHVGWGDVVYHGNLVGAGLGEEALSLMEEAWLSFGVGFAFQLLELCSRSS